MPRSSLPARPYPVMARSGQGQGLVEIALILGLVVIMAIGALGGMGGALSGAWNGTMKPAMQAPEKPHVTAQQSPSGYSGPNPLEIQSITYQTSTGSTACWQEGALNAAVGSQTDDWNSGGEDETEGGGSC
ncbi:MAG: hypothetical protein U0003_00105 [Vampirovibrionales bacterium]